MRNHLRFFALALSACLTLSTTIMAVSPSFSDVPTTYWAYSEIMEAVERGITNGYDDGTFHPLTSMTNAHFVAFLARAFYKGEYDDSNANPWWKPNTDVLDRHGVLDGTTLGTTIRTITVNQPINRYDMAQMMYNVLVDKGAQLPSEAEQKAAQAAIGDWNSVPSGYRNAVSACYAAGVLNGQTDGNFGGENLMNRAQGCVVVYRLTNYIAENPGDATTNPAQGNDGDDDTTPSTSTGTLANGKSATVENVLAVLEEIKSEYPEGTPWTSANTHYSNAFGMLGSGCAGYALTVSDEIFGLLPTRTHTDYDSIKPGDVIEVKNSSGETIHWTVAITTPDAEGWIQTTGAGSNADSTVLWGDWYDLSIAEKNGSIVWTRYPADGGSKEEPSPVSTATLTNGKPVTEINVLEILAEIKEEYPAGTPWTAANTYTSTAFGKRGIGCAAYAFMVSDRIFGFLPVRTHTDYSKIRPGDVIEVKNASGASLHWTVCISEMDAEGWFQTADGGSNADSTLIWGDWADTNDPNINWVVYTRYPQ